MNATIKKDFPYFYGFNEKPIEIKKKCESGYFLKKNSDLVTNKSVYGSISEVCDKNKDCKYILKLIPLKDNYFKTFIRESLIAPLMYKHGIGPKIYDMFICLNSGYIIMEKYDGSIRNILDIVYNNDMDNLIKIIKKMHNIGVIHNDLHTGNILYKKNKDNTYSYAITDYGLSTYFEDKNHILKNNEMVHFQFPDMFYPQFDYFRLNNTMESRLVLPFINYFIKNNLYTFEDYYILTKYRNSSFFDKQVFSIFYNNIKSDKNRKNRNITILNKSKISKSIIKNSKSKNTTKNSKYNNSKPRNINKILSNNNSLKKSILSNNILSTYSK